MSDVHAIARAAVADGDVDAATRSHLSACEACRSFERAVADVRRLAPSTGRGSQAPPDVGDRAVAALRASGMFRPPRRRFRHALLARVAIASVVLAVLGSLVLDAERETDLSDALLASAQRTEEAGSARLRLRGASDVTVDGRVVTVGFAGVGELTADRLHYRGLTRVGRSMVPSELTVVGPHAWARRRDGSWLAVHEPVGALAPVVLDAGSVLALLRLPKDAVRQVDSDATSRTVAFVVAVRPGLTYDVTATFGATDGMLRRVQIEAETAEWRTRATMELYGFGQPVTIHPPAEDAVVGTWDGDDAGASRAVFPFG